MTCELEVKHAFFLFFFSPNRSINLTPGDEEHRWHAKYLGIIVKLSQKHEVRFPDDALVVVIVVVVIDCSVPPMY